MRAQIVVLTGEFPSQRAPAELLITVAGGIPGQQGRR
jgi:hypothetical protein